jgi:hypothetical protein
MGWSGIKNLPPGFDVFGGNQPAPNIVDEAIRGVVPGLAPAHERLFADLKRNLLHRDYVRYFESCSTCAQVLALIEGGKYGPEILRDIIEPALATAVEQMESVKDDAARSRTSKRPLQYDAQPALDALFQKAHPLALAYPGAKGSAEFEARYREISGSVRSLLSP